MSELVHISKLFGLPQDVFDRLGGTHDQYEATWFCDICGIIEPYVLTNGYMPAKCACQRRASEQAEAEKIAEQQRQEARERRIALCAKCYNWLPTENVKDVQEIWNWSNFREIRYPNSYRELRRFTEESSEGNVEWMNYWVVGTVGTGKTRLMVTALNELSQMRINCRFLTANALFDAISRCMSTHQDYTRYLEEMSNCDVLLIDDLDKVYIKPGNEEGFQQKTLYSIINNRYNNRRPTWITSNKPDIASYIGDPAYDRLQENGMLIRMDGPSFRGKKFKVIE